MRFLGLVRLMSLAAAVAAVGACAPTGPSATPPVERKPTAAPKLPPGPEARPRPACGPEQVAPSPNVDVANREQALAAIVQGRTMEALRALDRALEANPSDIAAFTLRVAVNADVAEDRQKAGRTFARLRPTSADLAAPPHKNPGGGVKGPAPTLKRVKEERQASDWFTWVAQAGMKNPVGFGAEGEMPPMFGQTFNEQPVYASYGGPDYTIVRYGWGMLVLGQEGKGMRAVNLEHFLAEGFKAATKSAPPNTLYPEVRFATVAGDKLVALLAHEGDGQSTKADSFIVAIDLAKDKTAWVSDAGLGNAYSAHVTRTHVVTASSDQSGGKLNVLDLATGDLVASEPLPSRAEYVVGKGNQIFAWGYDKLLTFELSPAEAPAAPNLGALLREEHGAARSFDKDQACFLSNAVNALDRRDGAKAVRWAEGLPDESSVAKAIRAAGDFLIARASGTKGIDLTEKIPVPAQWLPTATIRKEATPAKPAPPLKFVAAKDPSVEAPKPPFTPQPRPTYSQIRIDRYPMQYGTLNLEGAFAYEGETFLVYGRRYVVTLHDTEVAGIIDLKPLLGDGARGSGVTPASFVTVLDGVAYVVVAPTGGGYEPPGASPKSANKVGAAASGSYAVALDPRTGKVLWRTAPGLLAKPITVFGDTLMVGQNDDKSGQISLVRLADGQVVQTLKTKTPISDFGWDGRGLVYVNDATKRLYFTLR